MTVVVPPARMRAGNSQGGCRYTAAVAVRVAISAVSCRQQGACRERGGVDAWQGALVVRVAVGLNKRNVEVCVLGGGGIKACRANRCRCKQTADAAAQPTAEQVPLQHGHPLWVSRP